MYSAFTTGCSTYIKSSATNENSQTRKAAVVWHVSIYVKWLVDYWLPGSGQGQGQGVTTISMGSFLGEVMKYPNLDSGDGYSNSKYTKTHLNCTL